MSKNADPIARKLLELRHAFDDSFAQPQKAETTERENLLSVRANQTELCIRLNDLATVAKARKIVLLPNPTPGLLGVCGLRGRLIAAFRLSELLGLGASPGPPRWLLLCRENPEVCFFVEEMNAYLQVSVDELKVADAGALGMHISHILRRGTQTWGVLDVQSILERICRHR